MKVSNEVYARGGPIGQIVPRTVGILSGAFRGAQLNQPSVHKKGHVIMASFERLEYLRGEMFIFLSSPQPGLHLQSRGVQGSCVSTPRHSGWGTGRRFWDSRSLLLCTCRELATGVVFHRGRDRDRR